MLSRRRHIVTLTMKIFPLEKNDMRVQHAAALWGESEREFYEKVIKREVVKKCAVCVCWEIEGE